jgi:predicted small lipoprotein YifL
MNYYNIFIIIFIIDVVIYVIESMLFYTYIKNLEADSMTTLTACKLTNIGGLYLPDANPNNSPANNTAFRQAILKENDTIMSDQRKSYFNFYISIVVLFLLITIYYFAVTRIMHKEINIKQSCIAAGIAVFFVLLIEMLSVNLVTKYKHNNPFDILLFFNNAILKQLAPLTDDK